ncbi:MAG TPA: SDR family NAD(P)-dependent oxidoreductase [Lentimicrobium sp.]|nr:SDR family NAD(P)-dependent oxidoreductase [Lentimicrobium sp.]
MNKVILITGANRGIGYEIALQTGLLGFEVIVSGRDSKKIQKAAIELATLGINTSTLLMDVSNQESIHTAFEELKSRNIRPDVLVNNAGISPKGDHRLTTDDESILQTVLNTNSLGPLRISKTFLPILKRPGRIIMISSSGGVLNGPVPGWSPAYCVSKTMLNSFTKQLAYDLRNDNIAVNAVCPGWVKTDMGGTGATRPVEKGAETPVWLVSESPQSLTGKFLKDKKEIPW